MQFIKSKLRLCLGCYILIIISILAGTVFAQGLPLPRYVSLKSNEVYVRVGPSKDNPISWVFMRKGYPVEIIQEFGTWRQIRDIEGAIGWVNVIMLSGKRTGIITGGNWALFRSPNNDSVAILRAEEGVIADILQCSDSWCQLKIEGVKGWLEKKNLWGVYPQENFK